MKPFPRQLSEISISRLSRLARHLDEAVKPGKFNLGLWFGPCNTSACAVGHACFIPEFQQAGLYLARWFPSYAGLSGWQATERSFDLSGKEAEWLFHVDKYKTNIYTGPQEVARRIREFIGEEVIKEVIKEGEMLLQKPEAVKPVEVNV